MSKAGLARTIGVLCLLGIVGAMASAAQAQGFFNVRFNVDRSANGPVKVNGTVTNEGRADALDIYVTAEALDAAGKVVGRGIAHVVDSLPGRASAPFSISMPAAPTATRFRVNVSSFRSGPGVQAS